MLSILHGAVRLLYFWCWVLMIRSSSSSSAGLTHACLGTGLLLFLTGCSSSSPAAGLSRAEAFVLLSWSCRGTDDVTHDAWESTCRELDLAWLLGADGDHRCALQPQPSCAPTARLSLQSTCSSEVPHQPLPKVIFPYGTHILHFNFLYRRRAIPALPLS